MLFRFLGGLGVGAASVCAPIYTAEVAPAAHRGRLVGLVQFNIVLGILLAYASNAIVRALADGDHAWRWMLGVMVVPAVVFSAAVADGPGDATVAGDRPVGGTRPTPSATASASPRRNPSSRWVRSGSRWRQPRRAISAVLHPRAPQGDHARHRDRVLQPDVRYQRDPLLRTPRHAGGGRQHQRRLLDECRGGRGEPGRHHGRAHGHRQDRPAQADDRRLDRLPDLAGLARGVVFFYQFARDGQFTGFSSILVLVGLWCSSPRTRSARAR